MSLFDNGCGVYLAVVSTSYITESTNNALLHGAVDVEVMLPNRNFPGFMVYAGLSPNDGVTLPPDLAAVFAYYWREMSCSDEGEVTGWLMFDADAQAIDFLPTYEW